MRLDRGRHREPDRGRPRGAGQALPAARPRTWRELLFTARRHVPFVQANLIGMEQDNQAIWSTYWRDRLIAGGVWANEPVPLYPYPSSPGYRALWGEPDDDAWERAHAHYLACFHRIQRHPGRPAGAAGATGGGMLRGALTRPRRVLMTLDAVGGVWRYSVDLARALERVGVECVLVGCGPEPSDAQRQECARAIRSWTPLPLDWMVEEAAALGDVGGTLLRIARETDADLLHLNLPSQAAGMSDDIPVVVAAHSCVATWWAAVKGTRLPPHWHWQKQLTARGFARADAVVVPSCSHGDAVMRLYGLDRAPCVVPNAVEPGGMQAKEPADSGGRTLVGRGEGRAHAGYGGGADTMAHRPRRTAGGAEWRRHATAACTLGRVAAGGGGAGKDGSCRDLCILLHL